MHIHKSFIKFRSSLRISQPCLVTVFLTCLSATVVSVVSILTVATSCSSHVRFGTVKIRHTMQSDVVWASSRILVTKIVIRNA